MMFTYFLATWEIVSLECVLSLRDIELDFSPSQSYGVTCNCSRIMSEPEPGHYTGGIRKQQLCKLSVFVSNMLNEMKYFQWFIILFPKTKVTHRKRDKADKVAKIKQSKTNLHYQLCRKLTTLYILCFCTSWPGTDK